MTDWNYLYPAPLQKLGITLTLVNVEQIETTSIQINHALILSRRGRGAAYTLVPLEFTLNSGFALPAGIFVTTNLTCETNF